VEILRIGGVFYFEPTCRLIDYDVVNSVLILQVYFHGFHGDVSETFLVGNVDGMGRHLVNVAKHCLDSGIAICGPGQPISVIGRTVRYCSLLYQYMNRHELF